jgi:hypothetical protein
MRPSRCCASTRWCRKGETNDVPCLHFGQQAKTLGPSRVTCLCARRGGGAYAGEHRWNKGTGGGERQAAHQFFSCARLPQPQCGYTERGGCQKTTKNQQNVSVFHRQQMGNAARRPSPSPSRKCTPVQTRRPPPELSESATTMVGSHVCMPHCVAGPAHFAASRDSRRSPILRLCPTSAARSGTARSRVHELVIKVRVRLRAARAFIHPADGSLGSFLLCNRLQCADTRLTSHPPSHCPLLSARHSSTAQLLAQLRWPLHRLQAPRPCKAGVRRT